MDRATGIFVDGMGAAAATSGILSQALEEIAAERAAVDKGPTREAQQFVAARLGALRAFFTAIDAGVGAFTQGRPLDPEALKNVLPMVPPRARQRG